MQTVRASDAVTSNLRRKILTMELPPGAVVTEANLVDLLQCSRTPLREALQRLAHEHLVVAVPRRGVSIADLSVVDFRSLAEAGEGIEMALVRLYAGRITDEEIDALDELVNRSEEAEAAGDLAQVVDFDFEIHHALGTASGNRFLTEFHGIVLRLLARYVYLGFQRAGTAAGANSDHRRIVNALRDRDFAEAEAAVRDHQHKGRDRMRAAL